LQHDTWGEAAVGHDHGPDLVHRDRAESVSDTSQHATDGGVARQFSLPQISLSQSSLSQFSNPSQVEAGTASSFTNLTTPGSFSRSSSNLIPTPTAPINQNATTRLNMVSISPVQLLDGRFGCSECPRPFRTWTKASFHAQSYSHKHACQHAGCRWSYQLHKDLVRHSRTHDPDALTFTCPVQQCSSSSHQSRNTFSRLDLLRRHVQEFHPGFEFPIA